MTNPLNWNDPAEYTHLTLNKDGSVFHKGEGKSEDCKICNPKEHL